MVHPPPRRTNGLNRFEQPRKHYNPSPLRGVLHKATSPQTQNPIYSTTQKHDRYSSVSTSGSSSTCSRTSSTLTLEDEEIKKIFQSEKCDSSSSPPWTIMDIPEEIKDNELHRSNLYQELDAGVNWSLSNPSKRSIWSTQPAPNAPPPMWYRSFHYGVRAETPAVLSQFARALVQCQHPWDDENVNELARFFVYRAAQVVANENDPLSAFAERVYQTFKVMPWGGLHAKFAQCLKDSALRTFVACWHYDDDSRRGIITQKSPTPHYSQYVSSALSLAKFIGELYKYDIIPRAQTIGCVRILLKNVKAIEHVEAIHHIIVHAGIKLWREVTPSSRLDEEVRDFIKFLYGCTVDVKDNASVMAKSYPPKELERRVKEVVMNVQRFQSSLKSGQR